MSKPNFLAKLKNIAVYILLVLEHYRAGGMYHIYIILMIVVILILLSTLGLIGFGVFSLIKMFI